LKLRVVKPGFPEAPKLTQYGTESALQILLDEAEFEAPQGQVANYIPELSRANADDRGISIYYLDGTTLSAGACETPFTIQSISKTVALLYTLESIGPRKVFSRVGKEPTGEPFNSGLRFQVASKRPLNPMINAGAIVVSSMFPGKNPSEQFDGFLNFCRKVCGNPDLEVDEAVYRSEKLTGHNNRSLAWIMNDRRVFSYKSNIAAVEFIEGILDVHFQQCSITVTTADLARFGAFLANLGLDPKTGERQASEEHITMVIALMASCGVYDGSGTFASKIGIPAKSGVGGGILTAVPGKMGIATYGPALDPAGNSCFGLYALERISKDEELGILSRPQISFSLKNYDTAEPLDELVEQTALRATSGKVVSYIPELAKVLPENRGVSLSTLDGVIGGGGQHSGFKFTLQAVCVPFVLAYILHRRGIEFVFSRVGREPTGDPFDADPKWMEIERRQVPFNPVINAGAILMASMLPEESAEKRRKKFRDFVRKACKNDNISVDKGVFQSETEFGATNRKLTWDLLHRGCFEHRPRPSEQSRVDYVEAILSDYFYACSLRVCCDDLATFAALLAGRGDAPAVSELRLSADQVNQVVTLMATCGLYNGSGEYAFSVGLPSKSGVSGGIMAVAPGKLGLAAFCSAVDDKGTSVFGRRIIEEISQAEQLNVFRGVNQ
jgi:glutaminase